MDTNKGFFFITNIKNRRMPCCGLPPLGVLKKIKKKDRKVTNKQVIT